MPVVDFESVDVWGLLMLRVSRLGSTELRYLGTDVRLGVGLGGCGCACDVAGGVAAGGLGPERQERVLVG